MKILKKTLVALLTLSLLLSCLVLFAHAEEPKLDGEIEDVLEYYTFRNYMEEDFSNNIVGEPYSYAPFSCPECGGHLTATRPKRNQYLYSCNNAELGECTFKPTSRNVLSPEVKFAPHGVSSFNKPGITTEVKSDNGNNYVEIINCADSNTTVSYTISPMIKDSDGNLVAHYTDSTIISFRIKTSNYVFYDSDINTDTAVPPAGVVEPESLNNGSNFIVQPTFNYNYVVKTGDKKGQTVYESKMDSLFAMNCNDNTNPVFTYLEYDPDWSLETAIYVQKTLDIKPALDSWYTIDIVMDYQNDTYTLVVTPDGGEATKVENISINGFDNTSNLELKIADGKQSGTLTCLDDIAVYDGTFIRHGVDVDKKTSDSIIALAALAKAETTSVADKVRIADVFDLLFNTDIDGEGGVYYTTKDTTPNKDKVDAIIADAKASYINKTYQDALLAYANAIPTLVGYYNRVDHVENNLARFDALFSDEIFNDANLDPEAIKAQFPGITDVAAIRAAKAAYDAEIVSISRARAHSEAFVELIKDFDPQNKSYKYMTEYLDALRIFDEYDPTYKYEVTVFVPVPDEDGNEIMTEVLLYSTVADAVAELTELVNKIEEIESTANAFIAAAKEVKTAESFKTVYENYLIASDIYADEIIHAELDNATYPGLVDAINDYLACMDQVYISMDESQAFIDIVTKAATKTYYVTILEELDKAAPYIDENVDALYAEPDYPGVAEAKAEYARLRELLAGYVTSAEAYIAAVNAIAGAEGFAAKKAAVEAALALKEKGDVIGIVGIPEANKTLATAESEIKVLEGNSAALKNAVLALKDAKTLKERRELIYIANSVKDNVETAIDGVSAAKTELETYVTQYNADVEALNSAFKGAVEGANAVAASAAPTAKAYITFDVIKLLLK